MAPTQQLTLYRDAHAAVVNALAWLGPLQTLVDTLAQAADAELHVANAQELLLAVQTEIAAGHRELAMIQGRCDAAEARAAGRIDELTTQVAERQRKAKVDVQAILDDRNKQIADIDALLAARRQTYDETVQALLAEESRRKAELLRLNRQIEEAEAALRNLRKMVEAK